MTHDSNDTTSETRHRLLEAAGEVFAEAGFHNATVREICRRANANVAAVNYHFGDKQELYAAVFRYARGLVPGGPPAGVMAVDAPPEARLRGFVRNFFHRLFQAGQPSWHGKLMAREMNEPTGALKMIVEQEIRPRAQFVEKIVSDVIGPASPEMIARCSTSIVGQVLHYRFAQPVMNHIGPAYQNVEEHIEEIAEQIVRFSMGGLLAIRADLDRQRAVGMGHSKSIHSTKRHS
jgi:AcrR family transcriptional regulator